MSLQRAPGPGALVFRSVGEVLNVCGVGCRMCGAGATEWSAGVVCGHDTRPIVISTEQESYSCRIWLFAESDLVMIAASFEPRPEVSCV
jgi:hypothetical protein